MSFASEFREFAVKGSVIDLAVGIIIGAAIELGVALLPPESLDLGDGEAGNAHLRERLADFVELERLDDGLDFLHRDPVSPARWRRKNTRSSPPTSRWPRRAPIRSTPT